MACQEKDTESLKVLQTELWSAFQRVHPQRPFASRLSPNSRVVVCRQAAAECRAEPPAPPGGPGAHRAVWPRHLVLWERHVTERNVGQNVEGTLLVHHVT